jgi:hypothetical protein
VVRENLDNKKRFFSPLFFPPFSLSFRPELRKGKFGWRSLFSFVLSATAYITLIERKCKYKREEERIFEREERKK